MAHDVLKANPAWEQYEQEGAALQAKRDALARHVLEARRPFEAAMSEHPALVRAALDAGEAPSPRPVEPDLRHLDDAKHLLEAQEREHRGRRDSVLAAIADDVLAGLADWERADNSEAMTLAPKVRRLIARRQDLRLAADVYAATDRHAGLTVRPSRADRVRRDVDADLLLDAAEADLSLLDPEPMLGAIREPTILRDNPGWATRVGEEQARAGEGVGFVNGGRFGNVDRHQRLDTAVRGPAEI